MVQPTDLLWVFLIGYPIGSRNVAIYDPSDIRVTYFKLYIYRVSRGNVPDFGRMFLTLKYTDITQNTYI